MNMEFFIETKGFNDIIDITGEVSKKIKGAEIKNGICLISCPGSTVGLTTIEYEEGALSDLRAILEKIVPATKNYEHCKKWGDCNGYAHIRSALIKPFLTIPIENSGLSLGEWQQVVLIDFDNRSRRRKIKINIIPSQQ